MATRRAAILAPPVHCSQIRRTVQPPGAARHNPPSPGPSTLHRTQLRWLSKAFCSPYLHASSVRCAKTAARSRALRCTAGTNNDPLTPSAATASRLRVVTWNVQAWRDSAHTDNFDRIAGTLAQLQPDVVCLNEVLHPFVPPPPEDPYWSQCQARQGQGLAPPDGSRPALNADLSHTNLVRLATCLQMSHMVYEPAITTMSSFGEYPFGNAILSHHPLLEVRHEKLAVIDEHMTLGAQKRSRSDLQDRGLITARVALPSGAEVGVGVTHLDHRAEELRELQARAVAQATARAFAPHGAPHFLCGDLNSFDRSDMDSARWAAVCDHYQARGWPPPVETSLVARVFTDAGYGDTWRLLQGSALPPLTCWSHNPLFRIDWVWAQEGAAGGHTRLRVVDHQTPMSDASDHFPVMVDFEVHQ